jgi:solute carrier family 25 folate transporter 32
MTTQSSSTTTTTEQQPIPNKKSYKRNPSSLLFNNKKNNNNNSPPPEWATMVAGTVAGVLNALSVGPLDVVKARQQIQRRSGGPLRYHGTLPSLILIYKEEGIRGLYRGFQPTLIGYVPTWALYFSLYNNARHYFQESFPKSSIHLHNMGAAVCAGAVANVATNPIWVIRTRLQTQEHVLGKPEYIGTWDVAKKMYEREGMRSFYKGMVPNMYALVHVAIQFPLYEKLKHYGLEQTPEQDAGPLHLVAAASISKLIASSFTYPLEVVRTRMHVQRGDGPQHRYKTVWKSLKTILKDEGVGGLYSGIQTNLVRVVPACAITFTSFELMLRFLHPKPKVNVGEVLEQAEEVVDQ